MSFTDRLKVLAQRAPQYIAQLETEEATKNALVMPFIQALGYDPFDPAEVVPEFTADVGLKRGEKVDYAIKHGGEIAMLFEAKAASTNLGQVHASQLFRYFTVTTARIAVLTNGVQYWFYSDLDEPNKMDERPFLVIDLLQLRDDRIVQLKKLTKEAFDLPSILDVASDLKYMGEIRRVLERQFTEPDDDFVRFFFGAAAPGRKFMSSARDQFAPLVVRVLEQVVNDRVSERLRNALERTEASSDAPAASPQPDPAAAPPAVDAASAETVVTTDDELEGYRIVKAIVCAVVDPVRVTHRDAKTYFAVLCDDNNRRTICRLHFNGSIKYLGLLDEQKQETRHVLERGAESLYRFANELRAAADKYREVAG